LKEAKPELRYQFERLAYFALDKDSATGSKPIFNRTITLRDTWAKEAQKG
jgi:glutaminyl-tRNA synthetase